LRRAALLGALLLVAGCGGGSSSKPGTAPAVTGTSVPAPVRDPAAGPFGARLLHRTALRARPDGKVLARLAKRTEFGSAQVLAVARVRGDWLAVRTTALPNGRLGWIRTEDARLLRETWSLEVDLSARRLTARHRGKRAFAFPVAIGKPDTPTPTGRFGVTDRLKMTGTTYGCCALALTGHQPHIAQGWGGGTRIAIHGTVETGSIGVPASHGCLRASERSMRRLMDVIPLGTTVRIHA
jgi:L,D-transpeptidase catalytic domain